MRFLKLCLTIYIILLPLFSYANPENNASIQSQLAALEKLSGGRLGVAALNTGNNTEIRYRADERFPMGCTSKVIGVAAVLKQSMTNPELLQQKITYPKAEVVTWSPITEKYVKNGMTVSQLCAATIVVSDNTAMNLLLKKSGGLQSVNHFARSIGDTSFSVDNWWPEEAKSGGEGNVKDSTTPLAMEKSLQKLALGNVLAAPQRDQLQNWMKSATTGYARIRAGVPKSWVVGDKTGTGSAYGTTNDIAVIWPPHCAPIVLVVYFTQNKKEAPHRNDIVATATKLVINELARTDMCLKSNK